MRPLLRPVTALLVAGCLWFSTAPHLRARSFDHGARIAVAGHSFHVGIAPVLTRLAELAGLPEQRLVGKLFVGNSQVIQVWDATEPTNPVKQALRAGMVDVLTLSPHAVLPDPGIDRFVELGLQANPNLRVTVQTSWAPFDHNPGEPYPADPNAPTPWHVKPLPQLRELEQWYSRQVAAQVSELNTRYGKPVLFVVPTARAVVELRAQIRQGKLQGLHRESDLFTDPMGHPGPALVLLNAYCHYAVIYRQSPERLVGRKDTPDFPVDLSRILAQLAWRTVLAEPLSGVPAPKPR